MGGIAWLFLDAPLDGFGEDSSPGLEVYWLPTLVSQEWIHLCVDNLLEHR